MKYFITSFLCLLVLPLAAQAKVNIFACEPEWGALAQEIGGDQVDVTVAASARQDPHHIKAKPSLLAAMRKADLVFCNGASLEAGWLPVLQENAARPDTVFLFVADYVTKLGVATKVDRSMGDVHPDGNPHLVTDPRNIMRMAPVVADRLAAIDPAHAAEYQDRASAFHSRWQSLIAGWGKKAASLQGQNVVVYHEGWAYLLDWLKIRQVAALEPKPGIPPSASHLQDVLKSVEGKQIKAILVSPYQNPKAAEWLSEKTGIPVVGLAYTVGGNDRADTLEHLYDDTIDRLIRGQND
ncbi:MAG: hypothetical protein AUJ12_04575 [Alphaproteobacteria bacterium CG1_02_46_17]|nr:MAG: hypothetical protein AUJ12_04575 [Alphaproteobacteria bacterium CG1_02_46_17]